MKDRIDKQLPYPTYDGDPENTPLDSEVTAQHITRDYRLTHLPDPHQEYDLYLSVLRGGNGLGDVLERDEQLIEDDLNEGLLLPRFLDSVYGAVARQDDAGAVDGRSRRDR